MSPAVPKVQRVRDPEYLRYLRSLPCCVCGQLGQLQTTCTEAHHAKTRGSGAGDDVAVPCCARHHKHFHLIGRKSFACKYGIDLMAVAQQLYREYQQHGWAA